MRLSTLFEYLLIFLLIAFAAYAKVIDRPEQSDVAAPRAKQSNMGVEVMSLKQATENVNKYCTCNANACNCCRNFSIPLVQVKGPGCALLQYFDDNKMAIQLSVGDNILTSSVINGDKPEPVCFPMPGGLTKFCARIYSIQRETNNDFKACLGLELQSSLQLEAALRVSCFRFGPDGVKLRPAEDLPVIESNTPAEEDDDDDFFGLGLGDDDDDDDADAPEGNAVSEGEDEDDDDDVLGFGELLDLLTGGSGNKKKKKPQASTPVPILTFPTPSIVSKPTVGLPITEGHDAEPSSNVKPVVTTPAAAEEPHEEAEAETNAATSAEVANEDEVANDAEEARSVREP